MWVIYLYKDIGLGIFYVWVCGVFIGLKGIGNDIWNGY